MYKKNPSLFLFKKGNYIVIETRSRKGDYESIAHTLKSIDKSSDGCPFPSILRLKMPFFLSFQPYPQFNTHCFISCYYQIYNYIIKVHVQCA